MIPIIEVLKFYDVLYLNVYENAHFHDVVGTTLSTIGVCSIY